MSPWIQPLPCISAPLTAELPPALSVHLRFLASPFLLLCHSCQEQLLARTSGSPVGYVQGSGVFFLCLGFGLPWLPALFKLFIRLSPNITLCWPSSSLPACSSSPCASSSCCRWPLMLRCFRTPAGATSFLDCPRSLAAPVNRHVCISSLDSFPELQTRAVLAFLTGCLMGIPACGCVGLNARSHAVPRLIVLVLPHAPEVRWRPVTVTSCPPPAESVLFAVWLLLTTLSNAGPGHPVLPGLASLRSARRPASVRTRQPQCCSDGEGWSLPFLAQEVPQPFLPLRAGALVTSASLISAPSLLVSVQQRSWNLAVLGHAEHSPAEEHLHSLLSSPGGLSLSCIVFFLPSFRAVLATLWIEAPPTLLAHPHSSVCFFLRCFSCTCLFPASSVEVWLCESRGDVVHWCLNPWGPQ